MKAVLVCALATIQYAAAQVYSPESSIKFTKKDETMTLRYKTYMSGQPGLYLGKLQGTLELKSSSSTKWTSSSHIRLCMEVGTAQKYK